MNAPCPPFPPYPPFPANPNVGDRFGSWVWNGSNWVVSQVSGVMVNMQIFAHPGAATYTPSPGLAYAVVEAWGGGGGGGGAIPNATFLTVGGGGGGSGGYSKGVFAAALLIGGVAINVGANGIGTAASQGAVGGTGGDTSFGGFIVAKGGLGGVSASPVGANYTSGYGGAGGPQGTGPLQFPGNAGQIGGYTLVTEEVAVSGGLGGAGPGIGGVAPEANTLHGTGVSVNGASAVGPCAGGGGAANDSTTATPAGGNGGAGLVVVTEYITLPAAQGGDCGQAPIAWQNCGPGWGGPC